MKNDFYYNIYTKYKNTKLMLKNNEYYYLNQRFYSKILRLKDYVRATVIFYKLSSYYVIIFLNRKQKIRRCPLQGRRQFTETCKIRIGKGNNLLQHT